jgi:glycosyltransferase involved in cell wall biosynthesis
MKVLYVNRSDIEGGAARAATSLLEGVRPQGVDARLYVQRKSGTNPFVTGHTATIGRILGYTRRILESTICAPSFKQKQGLFSPAFLPDRLFSQSLSFSPDIIHLHWVARMIRLETLARFNTPIVWTLHDSWPFTGGCFLPGDCNRYQEACGKCPALASTRAEDLSRKVWKRKREAWQDVNLTLIAPSQWMAECARKSSLFHDTRIEVIANGIDTSLFKPTDKRNARQSLSLPQDKKLVLFGAKSATQDRNKGFHLLLQALHELAGSEWRNEIELVVFGASHMGSSTDAGFKSHFMGWQNDDSILALLYAAADVFVLPSIQENLPYAAMEAMSCGTPCVAFRQGGVPDLIDHMQNGYLAAPFEPSDLARGIVWMLEDSERHEELVARSLQKVEQDFALGKVTERHMALYSELLNQSITMLTQN